MDPFRNDPQFIRTLFSADMEHNVFFQVGDPTSGSVERIGVVAEMLMAHSLMLRQLLNVEDTELEERLDFPMTDVTPRVFRNVLRYTYGHNIVRAQSLEDSVEMLRIAKRLVMGPMMKEVCRHICSIISPINICVALSQPACVQVEDVQQHISNIIRNKPREVLTSPHLPQMCPAGIRHIVQMDDMFPADVWRAVIMWARCKVLNEQMPSNTNLLETYIRPRLITPSPKNVETLSLNVIRLVEKAGKKNEDSTLILANLKYYYFIANIPPRQLYVCTEFGKGWLKHELFNVKPVLDCSTWMDPIFRTESELTIHTNSSAAELYSVVCTGNRRIEELVHSGELLNLNEEKETSQSQYFCKCVVKIVTVNTGNNEVKSQTRFLDNVMFNEEFEISLRGNQGDKVFLDANSKYVVQANFSSPHPLWYANEIDHFSPDENNDWEIGCGQVSKTNLWYGSHIKYLLFKPLKA